MKANGDKVTLRDLFTQIDNLRKEVTESINRLENSFNVLERGRLSNLETRLAGLEGRIFAAAGLIAFVISAGIGVLGFILK
mgnify:CR=1 FL=1